MNSLLHETLADARHQARYGASPAPRSDHPARSPLTAPRRRLGALLVETGLRLMVAEDGRGAHLVAH